ncbi:MAG: response regulator [Chloroflexi bacterium]|nr:response regulator [Chloroflexota bacterium]
MDELPAILLVDDNPGDVRLAQEALKEGKVRNRLYVVSDGLAALAFLRRTGPYATMPQPGLILLDLNMPRKGGLEVLAEIKSDPALQRIPVVILTSSEAEEDVARAYDLHANCYVTKPVSLERLSITLRSLEDFWFTIVSLPSTA